MVDEMVQDRLKGSFYGLLIGDALGAEYEFGERLKTRLAKARYGLGKVTHAKGEWTDDGALALALADSLKYGFSLHDQLYRYELYRKKGNYHPAKRCVDMGIQTRSALQTWTQYGSIGDTSLLKEERSGNGSIMRLSPVVVKYHHLYQSDPFALAEFCGLSSVTTHPSLRCVEACKLLGLMLASHAAGDGFRWLTLAAEAGFRDAEVAKFARPDLLSVVKDMARPLVRSTGYVIDTLEGALWCFLNSDSAEECIRLAAALGHDADTVAAVAGQLAGAEYGFSSFPAWMVEGLAKPAGIDKVWNGISKIITGEVDTCTDSE